MPTLHWIGKEKVINHQVAPPQEARRQSTNADQPQADFRKLKIRYDVPAVFALN